MKTFLILFCITCFLTRTATAQSPVGLVVETRSRGCVIPDDFTGVGFETLAELPDHHGVSGCLFSPTNAQLVTLFKNSGVRNLRLGGGTVDGLHPAVPSRADIDNLFGFARAAGIKIIYSLPLLDGNAEDDAATAKYIWTNYGPLLACFSIGNEPNEPPYHDAPVGAITNYAQFLSSWQRFATAVTDAVPEAKFTGPEAGGWDWVPEFARDEKNSGRVILVTHHEYVGGRPFVNHGRDEMPSTKAIDNMLSQFWITNKCSEFYEKTLARVSPVGLRCRMTEANDYLRGVTNASDAFASALWALDYMHWWAARGLAGVNFHNNQWLTTDTFYLDQATREYRINPKAYAIRAFTIGSHGWTQSLVMNNAGNLNLTAYAVADDTDCCVTIINKEHGAGARAASVTISPAGLTVKNAEVMFLAATNNDPGAKSGITLGDAAIVNHAPWQVHWTALPSIVNNSCKVTVPACSSALVKFSAKDR